ncbi:MAG: DtxR family transcriptional regulator [Bacteroidetes bacterium]|nr:DtxR family transcriptional regulator [Bacteroidota bacterium]MCW5894802.1 DtxR family transcriptional regulator [Bacteroidota bacterium]
MESEPMINPAYALMWAGAAIAILAIVFWPDSGVWPRWRRSLQNTRRVRIEDALKHLYDCEYKQLTATHKSVAGALSISGDEVARLLERLEELNLLRSEGEMLTLTEDGRAYALRVIRMHRLWERYLADETGLSETEWHYHAEEKEHILTADQADALAIQMGNPSFDPHGDPIPTAAGELPERRGMTLTQLHPHQYAEVVHIEDEPNAVYAQLVAQGIHPGVHLRMISIDKNKIQLEVEGVENVLAPIVAANVAVVPVGRVKRAGKAEATLADLHIGESARVARIARECRGQQRRRLMDLGILPGTLVTAEMRNVAGDPTAYSVRGALIALRKNQARMIQIERNGDSGA